MRRVDSRRGGLGFAVNFRLFFVGLVLFLGFVGGASAATLDVPGTYPTIQDAINAASPGDTINVGAGVYYENVIVNKSLTLQGENRDTTTINGMGGGDVVKLENVDDSVIRGFTITNSGMSYKGINLYSSSNNTITDNTVSTIDGDGIYLRYSSNNTIANNTVTNNRVGIRLSSSSNNTLTNNTALNNGNGISLSYSDNNTLTNNTASNNGHGISLSSSSNNILTDNTAEENNEFDAYFDASSDANCNNVIENNTGSGDRPIKYFNRPVSLQDETLSELIFCNADNSNIDNVTIKGSVNWKNNGLFVWRTDYSNFTNINSSNNGFGILLASSSNNTFTNNTASNNWVGIYLYSSNNNTIYNNYFNNPDNVLFETTESNDWNTTKTSGINIVGWPYLGGNYWAKPDGTGFSETCDDMDSDGICDSSYTLASGNVDYLPLRITTGGATTTTTTTTKPPTEENGGVCGPTVIVLLAMMVLAFRRRRASS